MCSSDCLLVIIAVLFPPLPVWVKRGICSADSIINIALCILGYLPGLLHAWYIIAKYPDPFEQRGEYAPLATDGGEGGYSAYPASHYVYVHSQPPPPQQPHYPQPQRARSPKPKPQQQYATFGGAGGAAGAAGAGQVQEYADGPSGSSRPPPSYSEVVRGDYKVQHD